MNFSLRIKQLREENELSQAKLAKALQVGVGSVGMWESTSEIPPTKKLIRIADFFDVSLDYLVGRSDDRHETSQNYPSQLSQEEKKLLSDWRGLAPELRQMIKDLILSWQSSASSVIQKKKA